MKKNMGPLFGFVMPVRLLRGFCPAKFRAFKPNPSGFGPLNFFFITFPKKNRKLLVFLTFLRYNVLCIDSELGSPGAAPYFFGRKYAEPGLGKKRLHPTPNRGSFQ
jgi:hypothetical protein